MTTESVQIEVRNPYDSGTHCVPCEPVHTPSGEIVDPRVLLAILRQAVIDVHGTTAQLCVRRHGRGGMSDPDAIPLYSVTAKTNSEELFDTSATDLAGIPLSLRNAAVLLAFGWPNKSDKSAACKRLADLYGTES